jgi:hypothetical protein
VLRFFDQQGVAAFAEKYAPQLEGDLAFHYRLDMRDLWRPGGGSSRLTWRRLKVLIDRLPPESATKTAARDALTPQELDQLTKQAPDGDGQWSHQELLTAALVDAVRQLIHVTVVANGGKSQPPKPLPRPGVGKRRRRLTAEGAAYLQQLRDQHAKDRGEAAGGADGRS